MASGILGAANLTAATNTTLYTVPSSKTASFSINFCNRNSNAVMVRLALGSNASPATTDWILYDVVVPGNGSLERTGLVLDTTKLAVVYSNLSNVTATAYGYEE
jgi:hypothetical protein